MPYLGTSHYLEGGGGGGLVQIGGGYVQIVPFVESKDS